MHFYKVQVIIVELLSSLPSALDSFESKLQNVFCTRPGVMWEGVQRNKTVMRLG